MKRGLYTRLLIVGAVLVAALPAAGGTRPNKLRFIIIGNCVSDSGGGYLHTESSGFTRSNRYEIRAFSPNGKPNGALSVGGYADRLGALSGWSLDCAHGPHGRPFPAGVYSLKITDESNGQSVSVKLRILAKSCGFVYSKCSRKQP